MSKNSNKEICLFKEREDGNTVAETVNHQKSEIKRSEAS
jgi:hypothetical protein